MSPVTVKFFQLGGIFDREKTSESVVRGSGDQIGYKVLKQTEFHLTVIGYLIPDLAFCKNSG